MSNKWELLKMIYNVAIVAHDIDQYSKTQDKFDSDNRPI